MNKIRLLKYCLLGIIVITITMAFLSNHRPEPDQGTTLNIAWKMWNGEKIYTDNFFEFVSPGSGLMIYYIWKLIGHSSFLSAWLASYVLWFLALIFLVLFCKEVLKRIPPYYFYLIASSWMIFFVGGLTNHNYHSSFISALSLFLSLKLINSDNYKKSITFAFLLGTVNAIIFWFLQTKGIAILLASCVVIFLIKGFSLKRKLNLIFGQLSSFLASLLFLFHPIGFSTAIQGLFIAPMQINYLTHNLTGFSPLIILAAVLITCGLISIAYFTRKNHYVVLSIFQLALFSSAANHFTTGHLYFNFYPTIIFVAIFLCEKDNSSFIKKNRLIDIYKKTYLLLSIVLIVSVIIINFFIFENAFEDRELKELGSEKIKRARHIYAGPFLAGLYFETRKENPYPVSHTEIINENIRNTVLQKIIENKPEIAFLYYEERLTRMFHLDRNNYPEKYIIDNYYPCPNKIYDEVEVYAIDKSWCPE